MLILTRNGFWDDRCLKDKVMNILKFVVLCFNLKGLLPGLINYDKN